MNNTARFQESESMMCCPLLRLAQKSVPCLLLAAILPLTVAAVGADQPASPEALWKKLQPFAKPPEEFAGKLGAYRSPLKFADGTIAKTPEDWKRRRAEI